MATGPEITLNSKIFHMKLLRNIYLGERPEAPGINIKFTFDEKRKEFIQLKLLCDESMSKISYIRVGLGENDKNGLTWTGYSYFGKTFFV